jgi:hypothetical protein
MTSPGHTAERLADLRTFDGPADHADYADMERRGVARGKAQKAAETMDASGGLAVRVVGSEQVVASPSRYYLRGPRGPRAVQVNRG